MSALLLKRLCGKQGWYVMLANSIVLTASLWESLPSPAKKHQPDHIKTGWPDCLLSKTAIAHGNTLYLYVSAKLGRYQMMHYTFLYLQYIDSIFIWYMSNIYYVYNILYLCVYTYISINRRNNYSNEWINQRWIMICNPIHHIIHLYIFI